MLFSCGDWATPYAHRKVRTGGKGFVKFSYVKKACVGDGRELERALDDVFSLCINRKKIWLSAERPRYELSAIVLRRICKQRFSQ